MRYMMLHMKRPKWARIPGVHNRIIDKKVNQNGLSRQGSSAPAQFSRYAVYSEHMILLS